MDLSSLLKTKTVQVALGLSLVAGGLYGCGSDKPSSIINTNDPDAKTYGSLDNIVDFEINNSSDSKESLTETKEDTIPEKNVCWEKTFGGDYFDSASFIQQTNDEGYILAGDTWLAMHTKQNSLILKLDSKGNLEWKKTFEKNGNDKANYVQQTYDNGYIVANNNALILKLDSIGNLQWEKTFGDGAGNLTSSIQQTNDLGYIVAGWTTHKDKMQNAAWVFKINQKGILDWQNTFVGSGYNIGSKLGNNKAHSIQQTVDEEYIVAGETNILTANNQNGKINPLLWVFKIDSKGNLKWDKKFGGKNGSKANSVQQTTDLGYIVAGSYFEGSSDSLILKLSENGDIEWNKTFGGKYNDYTNSIQQTIDGGYIVAGYTQSKGIGNESEAWIFKIDSKGILNWEKTFGGSGWDQANSIQQTTDLGYIIAGYTTSKGNSDAWILKLGSKGELCKELKPN